MPSPDVRGYVDLTLYDRDAQSLFDTALSDALTRFPDWVPREGNTEVVILEALALEVSYLIFAVNRLPGAVTEVLLRLFGVEPDDGIAASADLRFTLSDTLGHIVPAGTMVQLQLDGVEPVNFTTDEALVVPSGQSEGVVTSTATRVGSEAHLAVGGTTLVLLDAVVFVERVTLEARPHGGAPPESNSDYLHRAVERLQRLSDALVLARHFESYVLEQTELEIYRARAIDLYDPASGGDPGDDTGHVTVAVARLGGVTLTTQEKVDLESELEDRAHVSLTPHVVDPDFTDVDVTVTVIRYATHSQAVVQANVNAALSTYLSPDSWNWNETVFRNELIALVDGVPGVDLVTGLSLGADGGPQTEGDLVLPGHAPLTRPGALTVTVEAP